jgi:hypothetical protein
LDAGDHAQRQYLASFADDRHFGSAGHLFCSFSAYRCLAAISNL